MRGTATRDGHRPTMAIMSDAPSLDILTAADFRAVLGSKFRLSAQAVSMEVTLAEVAEAKKSPSAAFRASFSVLFHGALTPVLPQGIYRLEHDRLGALDLFLVPVGPVESAVMAYEAIFG